MARILNTNLEASGGVGPNGESESGTSELMSGDDDFHHGEKFDVSISCS